MSKRQKIISFAIFLFTFSVFIHPSTSSSLACTNPSCLTLLPPVCYTEEMYNSDNDEEHVSGEKMQDGDTKIEIRFKIIEIFTVWFEKLFKKINYDR